MRPHYRWCYEQRAWLLCEGYSPAIFPVRLV